MGIHPRGWNTSDAVELLARIDQSWTQLQHEQEAFDTAPRGTSSATEVAQCQREFDDAAVRLVDLLEEARSHARHAARRAHEKEAEQRGTRHLRGV